MTKMLAALSAALILALMATPAEAKRKRHAKAPRLHVAATTTHNPGCSTEYNHLAWCSNSVGPVIPLTRKPPKRLPDPPVLRTARKPHAAPVVAVASTGLVERARQYLGQTANQIGLSRATLWCSTFVNYITGGGTGSDLAKAWLSKPHTSLQVGAVAVMNRYRKGRVVGGHVGIVSGIDSNGNPIIISGNHGRRVRETVYSRHRIIAYVQPT